MRHSWRQTRHTFGISGFDYSFLKASSLGKRDCVQRRRASAPLPLLRQANAVFPCCRLGMIPAQTRAAVFATCSPQPTPIIITNASSTSTRTTARAAAELQPATPTPSHQTLSAQVVTTTRRRRGHTATAMPRRATSLFT